MSVDQINEDALSEIFEEIGIAATVEQIKQAYSDFRDHLEAMQEYCSHSLPSPAKVKEPCNECEQLRDEIKRLEGRIGCYQKSVKERTGANEVWIGNYGEVRYDY